MQLSFSIILRIRTFKDFACLSLPADQANTVHMLQTAHQHASYYLDLKEFEDMTAALRDLPQQQSGCESFYDFKEIRRPAAFACLISSFPNGMSLLPAKPQLHCLSISTVLSGGTPSLMSRRKVSRTDCAALLKLTSVPPSDLQESCTAYHGPPRHGDSN